jgi:putative salt-induced outer membrane protein
LRTGPSHRILPIIAAAIAVLIGSSAARAQDKELGWADTAELSYVVTSGNSETETLGFKNTLTRAWEKALFTLNAGGIRVSTTAFSRTATLLPGGAIDVDESKNDSLTAENYYLNGRYDRIISKRLFWHAGAGWDRNRFAGIDSRYTAFGGVGNVWYDTDDVKLRTTYAVTYNRQDDLVENPDPDFNDSYFGLRLTYEYSNKLTKSTTYSSGLVVNENLDETKDLRADWINSVAVAMTSRLALKTSLLFLYDNRPSFTDLDILLPNGTDTGLDHAFELDRVDTIFTASLVVNF